MTKNLKTMTLSAALAALFLSAGAFAGANKPPSLAVKTVVKTNVTIINKNSAWPVKGLITSNACAVVRCVEV